MKKKPIITISMIGICLIAFALQMLSRYLYGRDVVIFLFAKDNAYILDGEFWRFATANFLHVNWIHLSLNLSALWVIGKVLEIEMGWLKFFILCAGSGLCGIITSFLFVPEVTIGASAIGYGLWGAVILAIFRSNWKSRHSALILQISFLIGSLALGFFLPFDNYAHLGGLLFGVVFEALFCDADMFSIPYISEPRSPSGQV